MPHLAGELLKVHAGIDMLHVPYRGTGAALPDLLSGRNAVMFGDITSVLALLEAGRLKAFAITANQRSPLAPNVPTMPEAGLPGVLTKNWNALMGPIGLPQPIVDRLSDAIRQIAGDATYLGAMQKQGATPLKSSTAELTQHLKTERETLGPIIKAIGMKLE